MKNVIQKSILEKGRNYYSKHLEIVNTFFPIKLTPKEIELLGAFMNIDNPIAKEDRFNTIFRREVKKDLNLSDGGLSNYLTSLQKKAAIKENKKGVLYINPILFPRDDFQFYQFKLTKDGDK
jgi:hypothetical protein